MVFFFFRGKFGFSKGQSTPCNLGYPDTVAPAEGEGRVRVHRHGPGRLTTEKVGKGTSGT